MSGTALALVLTAAVLHALWNLAAKSVPDGGPRFVFLYFSLAAVGFLPVLVVLAVTGTVPLHWSYLPPALVSAGLHVLYSVVLQRGYAVGDLSVVYPVARGCGPLLSVLVAVLVLGERPGWLGLLGAVLIVAGVLVIGLAGIRRPSGRTREGVLWGVLTGATIAAYTLWDAHVVTTLAVPPVAYFGLGTIVQSLLLTPVAIRSPRAVADLWRAHWRAVLVVAVLSPVAYILVLQALRLAPVSLVAPAREASILVSGLIAWRVLREPHPARRLAGSAVVLAGIAAIALA